MVDTPILDRFEIGKSKEMVGGVIFGVEYLISAMKANMLGKMVFSGVYVWLFWGSDGPPIVLDGRYANPR